MNENMKEQENGIENTLSLTDRELGSKPVKELFIKYFLFALLGGLAPLIQVVADGIFLGNGVGAESLAAIGLLFPWFLLITIISNLIGPGGASMYAVEMGKGNLEGAKKILGNSVIYAFVFTAIISIISFIFLSPLITMLGGRGDIAETMRSYLHIYLSFLPFKVLGYTMFYFTRADERPALATNFLVVCTAISLVVEPLLIFKVGLGVQSSAIAAVILLCPSSLLLVPFFNGKSKVQLKAKDFRPHFKIINEINKIGFSSCAIQLGSLFVSLYLNNLLVSLKATTYQIGTYGIFNAYIYYVLFIVVFSFGNGIQPIVSFNYGQKSYKRITQTTYYGVGTGFVIMVVTTVMIYVLINPITGLFTGGDLEFFEVAKPILMKALFGTAFGTVAIIVSYYFQAVKNPVKATSIVLLRSVIFMAPLLILLPKFIGIDGVWYAFPLSEILTCIVSVILAYREISRLKKLDRETGTEMR